MPSADPSLTVLPPIRTRAALGLVVSVLACPFGAGASGPPGEVSGTTGSGAVGVQFDDYFKALNSRPELRFGHSVAITDRQMLVGSFDEDGGSRGIDGDPFDQRATNSGAVYAFEGRGSLWVVGNYIKASNADPNDQFGFAVAISGATAVVSAPLESSSAQGVDGNQNDNTLPESGAVYVFGVDRDGWTQQAYLKASNPGAQDIFGASVDIDGDLLVVGAPYEDSTATGVGGNQNDDSGNNAGAVYVFQRSNDVWTQIAYVKAPQTGLGFGFGECVAVSGNRFVVGSQTEDSNATGVDGDPFNTLANQSGAAYVYRVEQDDVVLEAYLKASNTGVDDRFGCDLAMDGDTIAVGAQREASAARNVGGDQLDNSAMMSGAVYVFHRTAADGWQQQAYIKAVNTEAWESFGGKLALAGDLLAVGVPLDASAASGIDGDADDNSLTSAGSVQLYRRSGATWSTLAYVKPPNPGHADLFGTGLALGNGRLAVGAVQEDSDAQDINGDMSNDNSLRSGAVYTFAISALGSGIFADGFEP